MNPFKWYVEVLSQAEFGCLRNLGFSPAHLQESPCCQMLGRSLPWGAQSTVLLGGHVPASVQIIYSGLYFFLRTLICLWKRLSSTALCGSGRLDVTHRVTLMPVFLYTAISYTPGCSWGDSDHKNHPVLFWGYLCLSDTMFAVRVLQGCPYFS